MDSLYYFAYGSNMSQARLQARVPSARRHGVYRLEGHQLSFHKRGRDGSGKCDAFATGGDGTVFGVVFRMRAGERAALDRVEGLGRGYDSRWVDVTHDDGHGLRAFTYVALDICAGLAPFDWYHEHVLRGAAEADLPAHYLGRLRAVAAVPDPDRSRRLRELSIYAGDD